MVNTFNWLIQSLLSKSFCLMRDGKSSEAGALPSWQGGQFPPLSNQVWVWLSFLVLIPTQVPQFPSLCQGAYRNPGLFEWSVCYSDESARVGERCGGLGIVGEPGVSRRALPLSLPLCTLVYRPFPTFAF